jgi:hypothetical protein
VAAEQRSGGRECACGCGRSIEHMRADAKWSPFCKPVKDRKREHDRRRAGEQKARTARYRQNVVEHRLAELALRARPQKLCSVCCGMPWARTPERVSDVHRGGVAELPVAGDSGLCRGCGEAWAPEPPPEPLELLSSSATALAAYGELHATNYLCGYSRPEKKGKGDGR